jgi:hypothetical protein
MRAAPRARRIIVAVALTTTVLVTTMALWHTSASASLTMPAGSSTTISHEVDGELAVTGPEVTKVGGRVDFTVIIPDGLPDTAVLRVDVHNAITTPEQLDDQPLLTPNDDNEAFTGDVVTRVEPFINTLDMTGMLASVSIELGSRSGEQLRINREGIYPLTIEVRNDGVAIDRVRRWLIVSDTTPPARPITVVARIIGTPDIDADGNPQLTTQHSSAFDALARLSDAMPVAAEVSGSLLALHDPSSLTASTQLVSSTYVPIDSSLTAVEEGQREWTTQRAVWSLAAKATAQQRLDDVAIVDRLDTSQVTLFDAAGVATVIDTEQSQPVTTTDLSPVVLGPDRDIARLVTGQSPSDRSQRRATLAAPALLGFNAQPSMVVLDLLGPDRDQVDNIIETLTSEPLLQPQPFARWRRSLRVTAQTPTAATSTVRPVGADRLSAIDNERARLASLQSMIGRDNERLAEVTQLLLLAPTSTRAADAAEGRLDEVSSPLEELINDEVSGGRTISLNVALRRTFPEPVTVLVRLAAERNRLKISQSEQLVTLDGRNSDGTVSDNGVRIVTFTVEAVSSGTVDVTVQVFTPDGRIRLVPDGNIRVRSFAVSGVGLALTFGAGGLLALWWWRHLRDRARARRADKPSPSAVL